MFDNYKTMEIATITLSAINHKINFYLIIFSCLDIIESLTISINDAVDIPPIRPNLTPKNMPYSSTKINKN